MTKRFLGNANRDRRIKALCDQYIINGNAKFAEFFADSCEVQGFAKNDKIISQGGTDADLFLFMRKRTYDPTSARFLTKEPLGPELGGDINPYRYVGNNPVSSIDPTGEYRVNPNQGESCIKTDEGIRLLIDAYLNQSNGNVSNAFQSVLHDRNDPEAPNIKYDDAAASADHYLFVRDTINLGIWSPPAGIAAVAYYTPAKFIQQTTGISMPFVQSDTSPASANQMKWGYKGIADAVTCH
jgi:RHS repeat-associated protein